jgi:MFS family permease
LKYLRQGRGRDIFLSLYLPAGASGLSMGITAPVLPVLAKSFDVSVGVATLVFVVHMAGSASGTLPTGFLIDRIGRRKVLLAGPLITAAAAFLVATADSFPELLVYRFIGGWGQQMWALSRLTLIADTGGAYTRGRQVTSMFGAQRVGALIGPAAGGFMAVAWGLEWPFIVQGAVLLLGMLPSFFVVQETAPNRKGLGTGGSEGLDWRALLKSPYPGVFSAQFLVNVARGGVENGGVLFLYGVYAYNAGPDSLGLLSSILAGASIPIALVSGMVMDTKGRKYTVVPGTLALAGSLAFMGATSFADMPFAAFIGAFVALHISVSLMLGSWQTMATDIAPVEGRGTFLGLSRTVSHSGRLSSPTSFGLFSEIAGFGVAFLFLGAASLATAIVIAFFVPETLGRSATPEERAEREATRGKGRR